MYPSQANYFLCGLRKELPAGILTEYLLDRFGIFIKDLSGKKGIPGDGWVRIAVRNRADNDILIGKLRILEEEFAGENSWGRAMKGGGKK
ncbi:MAG: hypothetical protein LBB68_02265 [Treponema sp.]|nr:hypothetical protein [Treponema sp.]